MLRLYSQITIGNYYFDYVHECTVSSTYEQFTDRAVIVIPSKFRDVNKTIVNNNGVFKRGDAVEIKLGYYPNLTTVFKGFVSKIKPDSPLVIECEDAAWKLKQQNIANFYQKDCTVKMLLAHLIGTTGIEYDAIDANLGTFKINNKDYVNIIDCLDEIKKNFGLFSWVRDGKLYVGYPNTQQFYTTNDIELSFQEDIIESQLEYTITNHIDVVLKGISNKLDDTKITRYCYYDASGTIIVGDAANIGEQRTFNYIDITETQLDDKLREMLPKMIYNGYKGSFTTLGQPVIKPLDSVTLKDAKFPEREGKYLVKRVDMSFGMNGYRQNVELDQRMI